MFSISSSVKFDNFTIFTSSLFNSFTTLTTLIIDGIASLILKYSSNNFTFSPCTSNDKPPATNWASQDSDLFVHKTLVAVLRIYFFVIVSSYKSA